MFSRCRFKPGLWAALLVLSAFAGAALADPPDRVARLSYISGDVSFAPAGDNDWSAASLNRPLVGGDRLYTDRDSRVELELGAATLRLNERSGFRFLNLDDRSVRIELTQGTLSLHVGRLDDAETYEVDTPTLAFVISRPGEYRIDVAPRGASTGVTVFDGAGVAYGAGDASYRMDERRTYRFRNSSLTDYEVLDLPQPDDFDNWCFTRDDRYRNSVARRYVPEEMIGASDLDDYGGWNYVPSYGNVWFPYGVAPGWAPYRSGYWAWVDPWGWTWVDSAPWGFAPFHYGRWVYWGNRWGWLPGPVAVRPVYAPALVVFFGGHNWRGGLFGGAPVGWCPLGPHDIYVPPYPVSRNYFRNVNVTNIHNTTVINNTSITNIYEHHKAGHPLTGIHYAYRNNPDAITAVERDTFTHARPVAAGRLHLNRAQLEHAEIVNDVGATPVATSRTPAHAHTDAPPATAFNRDVIRHAAERPRARTPDEPAERASRPLPPRHAVTPSPSGETAVIRAPGHGHAQVPAAENAPPSAHVAPPSAGARGTADTAIPRMPSSRHQSPITPQGENDGAAPTRNAPRDAARDRSYRNDARYGRGSERAMPVPPNPSAPASQLRSEPPPHAVRRDARPAAPVTQETPAPQEYRPARNEARRPGALPRHAAPQREEERRLRVQGKDDRNDANDRGGRGNPTDGNAAPR